MFVFLSSSATNVIDEQPNESVAEVGVFQQQEDEARRRKIELEAEERKLEETLKYQRRIEDEAKQRHLAELHKNSSRLTPMSMVSIFVMILALLPMLMFFLFFFIFFVNLELFVKIMRKVLK